MEAQERMKKYANHKMIEKQFQIGDQVYLKLKPYK